MACGFLQALRRLDCSLQAQSHFASFPESNQWTLATSSLKAVTYAGGSTDSGQSPLNVSELSPHVSSWSPAVGESSSKSTEKGRQGRNSGRVRSQNSKNKKNPEKLRSLACPVHKYCVVHNRNPVGVCKFSGAANMSEVAQHLRSHHRSLVGLLLFCRTCWKFSINSTKEGGCTNSHDFGPGQNPLQPRGETRVAELWRNLYWKIYPTATREPSPCT